MFPVVAKPELGWGNKTEGSIAHPHSCTETCPHICRHPYMGLVDNLLDQLLDAVVIEESDGPFVQGKKNSATKGTSY